MRVIATQPGAAARIVRPTCATDVEKDGNGAVRYLCVPGFSNRPRGCARRPARLGNTQKVEGAAGVEPAFSR